MVKLFCEKEEQEDLEEKVGYKVFLRKIFCEKGS